MYTLTYKYEYKALRIGLRNVQVIFNHSKSWHVLNVPLTIHLKRSESTIGNDSGNFSFYYPTAQKVIFIYYILK